VFFYPCNKRRRKKEKKAERPKELTGLPDKVDFVALMSLARALGPSGEPGNGISGVVFQKS